MYFLSIFTYTARHTASRAAPRRIRECESIACGANVFAFSVYIHRQADGQDSIREAARARALSGLLTWLCSKHASSADSMPAAVSSPPRSQHLSALPSPAAPMPANAGIYHSMPPCASSFSVSGDSLCVEREREERERERVVYV